MCPVGTVEDGSLGDFTDSALENGGETKLIGQSDN